MPKKSVKIQAGNFGSNWRRQLENIARRRVTTLSRVAKEILDDTIDELEQTAPYTHGQLLGKPQLSTARPTRSKFNIPKSKQGFRKFRRENKGRRVFVLANAAWPLYGAKLEKGRVQHNPVYGGRPWSPGFVQRALRKAKDKALIGLRRRR